MYIVCLDLEGVLVPEIWIQVAKKTGIKELRLTTRDVEDYDMLMKSRLNIMRTNGLTLKDIQNQIALMEPLEGAYDFLKWLRSRVQTIIVSDTFEEFSLPLMKKLGRPTLLCHSLTVDKNNSIVDYNLRQQDAKRKAIEAVKSINYSVIAVGDSYNDISMLKKADKGILFRPSENVKEKYPQFNAVYKYNDIKAIINDALYEKD